MVEVTQIFFYSVACRAKMLLIVDAWDAVALIFQSKKTYEYIYHVYIYNYVYVERDRENPLVWGSLTLTTIKYYQQKVASI